MKTIQILTILFIIASSANAQIAVSHLQFVGNDAEQLQTKWGIDLPIYLPVVGIPFGKKDSANAGISLAPGIRWTWANFEKNLIAKRKSQQTYFIEDPDPNHQYRSQFYRSSSFLQTTNLSLGLLLQWYPEKPSFSLVAGVYADYLIGGKFKRTYKEDGQRVRKKDKLKDEGDFYGLRRWNYGVVVNFAYNRVMLYGRYALSPLFESDQSIDIHELSIGVGYMFIKLRPPGIEE